MRTLDYKHKSSKMAYLGPIILSFHSKVVRNILVRVVATLP